MTLFSLLYKSAILIQVILKNWYCLYIAYLAEGREEPSSGSTENGEEARWLGPKVSLQTVIQSSSPWLCICNYLR